MKKIFVAALLLSAAFAWWFGDGPVLRNQLGIQQGKAAPAPAVVTYTVVLSAANPENLLLPGMTALVRITVNRTGPVLKVPLAALRYVPKPGQGPPPTPARWRAASPPRSGSPARTASRKRSRSASARTTP